MKYLITTLFYLFLAACSDVDLGGFTESIVKNADTSYLNSSPTTQKPVLKKTAYPLDEDLSSLDEDELREKLMNTYPWPLAKDGEINDGTFDLPHNPYTGEIKDFKWKNVNPTFAELSDFNYGFDRDPTDKDPVVYISTKTGEDVTFVSFLSKAAFENYYLWDDSKKPINFQDENKITPNDYTTLPSNATTYSLYGCLDKKPKRRSPTCYNLQKKIQVIPYDEDKKNIVYVQLDGKKGDKWDSNDKDCKKGFNQDCFVKKFNEIFNQAIVYSNVKNATNQKIEIKPGSNEWQFDDHLITLNMTSPQNNEYNDLIDKANFLLNDIKKKEKGHWQIVYVINKERKEWHLKNCLDSKGDGDLSKCNGFKPIQPELENPNTTYHMYSPDKCNGIGKDVEVKIRAKDEIENGETTRHYYAYLGTEKAPYKSCDILYTENGYPVIPHEIGILGASVAFSQPSSDKFDDYLPYESVIFVSRGVNESSYYVLMHELGHSFGLTDVSASNIFEQTEHDGKSDYTNYYASSETNLMSWTTPAGKKLRYRKTPIVCTGGTSYKDILDDRTYLIERPAGGVDNQWKCIRDCHKKDLTAEEDVDVNVRKYYFNKSFICEEDVDKNRVIKNDYDRSNFIKDYNAFMDTIIINRKK